MLLHRFVIAGIGLFILSAVASADEADARMLRSQFSQFSAVTKPIVKSLPLRIQSREQDRHLRVNVYGLVNYPFSQVADVLARPAVMCDFLILNLNVKTCTYLSGNRRANMVIYVAGKNYTPLYRTLQIKPYFELLKRDKNYLRVLMTSSETRRSLRQYSVLVEASPYKNRTLVRFKSNYRASLIGQTATVAYLKTFARKKVGFTVIGRNQQNQPQYIRGMQGVIERNAVRSYLALQAYLETAGAPPKHRFETRLRRWFELTDVYTRDRKSTRLNSSHTDISRMPSSA